MGSRREATPGTRRPHPLSVNENDDQDEHMIRMPKLQTKGRLNQQAVSL